MKNKSHMEKIKEHFENEAVQFDEIIYRLIPYYNEMLEALVLNLPFSNSQKIKVIDVGCGTGTISSLVAKKYPKAEIITCLNALNKGGIFINVDIVLAATDLFQTISIKKWKEYMNRTISEEEIENKWFVKYKEEDYPAKLLDQIGWLKEIRFKDIEIFWKYYNFAVFGSLKYG